MEDENRIKSVSTDPRSKKRLRYTSTQQRAKNASADVYRSYKRRLGVTSAASREERVHHPQQDETNQHKRARKDESNDCIAVLHPSNDNVDESSDSELDIESTFASELDLAHDRNASEIFSQFYRDVWHLVQSLPEVLHHASDIVDILMSYLLSPQSTPEQKSLTVDYTVEGDRITFIANQATTDVLHLLAVLARDLRHEIHPFVHTKIIPRIVYDLLNPPVETGKQPLLLSVKLVETAFRTLAYVFRYNAEPLLSEVEKEGHEPCLDKMRHYYGATLGHKRDYVRRLAAESFAPMIRKLKTDGSRRKHIRRVLRALAASGQADSKDGVASHSLKRAQTDAVDGVAYLLFETARGMPGRLHSKGNQVIRCVLDCLTSGSTKGGANVLYSVTSAFLEKICTHLKRENFSDVWRETFQAATTAMVPIAESDTDETSGRSLSFNLELVDQIIAFNGGIYIRKPDKNRVVEGYDECVKNLVHLLKQLLEPDTFCRLSSESRVLALKVLASSWRALPDNPKFFAHISPLLPAILSLETEASGVSSGDGNADEAVEDPATILARSLLPYLPSGSGMKLVGRAILVAAVKRASKSPTRALMLVFSVASIRRHADPDGVDVDDDNIFFMENAPFCGISSSEKRVLVDLCLVDAKKCSLDSDDIAKLGIAVRCLPFLLLAGKSAEDSNIECRSLFKRMWKWALGVFEVLDNSKEIISAGGDGSLLINDVAVAKSLLLESCAKMATICVDEEVDSVVVKNNLSKMRPYAEKLLLECPHSMWTVKGVAAFVDSLRRCDLLLSDSANQIFEALIPNLREKTHFLRLHSLEILASFPKRPFITDHAEIDWTDDLDEEPSTAPSASVSRSHVNSAIPAGLCDVIDTLLTLESTPISFQNERHIVACITRIEVLSRSGRMPVVYAETVSNHLLGMLHVKFSPIWPAAVRALVSLAGTNESFVWEPLSIRLKEVTTIVDVKNVAEEQGQGGAVSTYTEHHQRCMAWESTYGKDPGLFRDAVTVAREEGRVSRHSSTDEPTVFGLVWSVLENAPELTAKKSRTIVPIFLEFLHWQYFHYHGNDPDARELRLESEIEDGARLPLDRSCLGRSVLDKRLLAFLKVFAAVNGPQQLYKHHLLLSIFTCFVSNQEAVIAQSALSCVLKFKQPFLIPYADHLKGMLKKGALRDTMLSFDISKESQTINPDHRASLIPLVTRIMFGRLSARAAISKSSKETPAARRAAVLSFLSVLDGRNGELYPLFYQMVRSYIPRQHVLQPIERQEDGEKEKVPLWLESVNASDLLHLRDQRHEGFLNLLSAAISQLGHGIQDYVPAFMSIILALCKHAEVVQGASPRIEGKEDEHQDTESDEERHRPEPNRKGVLRTLCFRRLAELHDTYASSIDFLPYAKSMWETLSGSVHDLPVTVAYADKAPALLSLMKTLSARSQLIPILSFHAEVLPSTIKCISDVSKQSVANAALDIVENLMTNGGDAIDENHFSYRSSVGIALIEKHTPLLLRQLSVRLGSNSLCRETTQSAPQRRVVDTQCTRRRELSILCRISSLVLDGIGDDCEQEVLRTLCDLLIPFLSLARKSNDQDQMNILEILSALIPRIEEEAAIHYFPSLSLLFGPYKASCNISSLPVRKLLASVIKKIADSGPGKSLQPVAHIVVQLCAVHSKRVDEIDVDEVLSALNDLGAISSGRGWCDLCNPQPTREEVDPTVLSPLINLCFHFLYDEDGVVSRAAFKALKTLITFAAQKANYESDAAQNVTDKWVKLVETMVAPTCRSGLSSKNKAVRRLFILLFAEMAQCFKEYASPNLYGDLTQLIRDDDPDLDFFLNVTHVQIHRRSKAFQRLRKMLLSESECPFSTQSLSNFLLPIVMHPIYESKTKADEALALDAIETVGALAMHLSWSKYHNMLWTLLNQFERNPEQERYMIGVICSVIDAFHFELVEEKGETDEDMVDDTSTSPCNNAVWKALERRIIPKTENLLVKEKIDRTGTKVKNLRPSVVLALSKLLRKFPVSFFETRLNRLIVVVCGALRSRDSDARDIARKTLATMTAEVGVEYLSDVIRHLAVSLTEGYQLHVRMATLHTILQTLAKSYQPSVVGMSKDPPVLHFDTCIPAMMDLIQQDLFGAARERREAEGAMKRLVKEASGSKSTDAVELICRTLTFMPSSVARASETSRDASTASAIHAVVIPLLERLRTPDISTRIIGRIGECLTRVVVGVSHNKTATSEEILPFVYATFAPFVGQYESTPYTRGMSDDDSSEDEANGNDIQISRTVVDGNAHFVASKMMNDRKVTRANVVEWRPSTLNAAGNAFDARDMNAQQRSELRRVQDGASAPKLTGSGRHTATHQQPAQSINDQASISGVTFGLRLLHSFLKKGNFATSDYEGRRMLDAFIPVLTTCVCSCSNNEVIMLSLRCLAVLLRLKLPSVEEHSSSLGAKTLDILTSSGSLSNLNQELTQACFRTLTLLIHLDAVQTDRPSVISSTSMPLDEDQMQVLISLLKAAVIESDHHHHTLGLIKAIVSRQFMSPEFYDLMDIILDLSVKSNKATLRQMSSKIFMQYLVTYPMGEGRLEDHLKQVVLNVKYEYEEGRLSAVALVSAILEKLPVELLEKHAQLFFLPLVLQFVNDESKDCREALSDCLSRLLSRAPIEVVQSFYDYTERWSLGTGPLKRTSLQLFGIFIDSRADFLKKGDVTSSLISRLYETVHDPVDHEWEIQYFALLALEKLSVSPFCSLLDKQTDLWATIVAKMLDPHPWIKRVSSRMVGAQLCLLDATSFASNTSHFLVQRPGLLYQVARNLSSHFDLDEEEQNEELSAIAIKTLVWTIQAMKRYPELCYAGDHDNDEPRNPEKWLMARLSNLAKPKGSKRRESIFKCFAAFITVGGMDLVMPYLELILEPLHRSITESDQMMDSIQNSSARNKQLAQESEEATLAKDVLHMLEESCGDESEAFLRAFGAVKTRAKEKREDRKKRIATEAVVDPQASAMRKMKKHVQEKRRRKRKVDTHRRNRGGQAKRRHL